MGHEAKRRKMTAFCWLSPFSIQSGAPACRMVPPTFWVDIPSLFKHLRKQVPRHIQSLCIINLQGISKSAQINNEDLSSPLPHIYYSLRFKWRIFFRTQLPNPIHSSDIGFHIQKYHQTWPIWSTLSHLQNLFKLFFSWVVT